MTRMWLDSVRIKRRVGVIFLDLSKNKSDVMLMMTWKVVVGGWLGCVV